MSTSSSPRDGAAREAAPPPAAEPGHPTRSHADIPEIMASLPLETRCWPYVMRQYGGFWLPEMLLKGIAATHAGFDPRPDDVFLASLPKSGTTWLKALAFATLNRAAHSPFDAAGHPLRRRNPHDCVDFLEVGGHVLAGGGFTERDPFAELPSPRLLATHMPYSLLPRRITDGRSGCRLVYICRDPKDVVVSFFLFTQKVAPGLQLVEGWRPAGSPELPATLEEVFELFCDGRGLAGPHWRHALEYWEESRRRPDKVFFLRYEELVQDPVGSLRKLAAFMGCPFSGEEEDEGVARKIVELCSLQELKSLEVNRNGSTLLGLSNKDFFRKGGAGDWRNHLMPDMAARLDKIVGEALRGSGLSFPSSV